MCAGGTVVGQVVNPPQVGSTVIGRDELGSDAQAGHSAAAALNHPETFAMLKRISLGERGAR